MNILYFDCPAGISGDMALSALLALGVSVEQLTGELNKLGLDGWRLELTEVTKLGIVAKHIKVIVKEPNKHSEEHNHLIEDFHSHSHDDKSGRSHEHNHSEISPHEHRSMADIALIIDKSGITDRAKDLAKRIFYRLAVAEAKVHGTTPDKVYFHEVGAVDSIIDIVGVAVCIDILSLDAFYASVLHDGYGFVNCRHGKIPVPVPAVTELLAARGATFRQLDIEGELMTPTGAAIVTELAESFGPMPEMNIQKTVYGAGTKDFPVPDVLRLVLGEKTEDKSPANDIVTVIETNIDDSSPEILAYTMKRLMEAGARDVFFTPVYMKKNRPATLLSVICDTKDIHVMEQIIFAETSTIGLRKYNVERKLTEISTPYVTVKAKEIISGNESRLSPEYEDARRLALEKGVPLQEIYRNFREFS